MRATRKIVSIRLKLIALAEGEKKGVFKMENNRNYENSFLCIFILINGKKSIRDDEGRREST